MATRSNLLGRMGTDMRNYVKLGVAVALVVAGADALAITTTGRINGAVVDPTGLPVEAARVEVTSPALQGKKAVATTADGEFRFTELPPGTYAVSVTAEGFRDMRQEGIIVTIGGTAQVDVVLEPPVAETQETVVVTARPTVVDTERTQMGQSINQSFMANTLIDRDYQSASLMVPGVQDAPSEGDSDARGNPVVHGANPFSNQYLLDGINMTDPNSNTFSRNLNFDAIEEVEVLTGGRDAEYGGAMGGVLNVVTKSGGNKFTVDGSIYYQPDTSELRRRKLLSGDSRFLPEGLGIYRKDDPISEYQSMQANLNVGGPIIKDKLWFFVSNQVVYNQASVGPRAFPGAGGVPREFRGYYGLAKLTYQATPWQRFQVLVQGDPTSILNERQDPSVHPDAEGTQMQGGGLLSVSSDTSIGEHVLLKNKLAMFSSYIQVMPASGDFDTPGRSNQSMGTDTENFNQLYRDTRNRLQYSPQLVVLWDRVLGSHETKVGADLALSWQRIYDSRPGGRYYTDTGVVDDPNLPGTPFYETRVIAAQDAFINGDTMGLYVQDMWKPFRSLTIRPGLRFDSSRMRNDHSAPDEVLADPQVTGMDKWFGAQKDGLKSFFDSTVIHFNVFSPRFGIAWDPLMDGKTVLHAGLNRYTDTGYLFFPSAVGRSKRERRYEYNPVTGKYDIPSTESGGESGFVVKNELSGFNPFELPAAKDVDLSRPWAPRVQGWAPLQIFTGEHVPKTDELVVGVTREIVESVSINVDGILRYYTNLYDDTETNLIWNADGSDAVDGRNGKKDYIYSLGTPDEAYQIYYGFDVSLRKYLTDRFEGFINYAFGVNRGTTNAPFSVAFDREKQFPYLFGFLEFDRRHILRIAGYYHLPLGFTVGGMFSYLSGAPYNKLYLNNFYGDYTDMRAPRGYDPDHPGRELRMPDQFLSQARFQWDAEELTGLKLSLITDVDNVLNLRTVTSYEQRNLPAGSPTQYGQVLGRSAPTSFTFGMRFQY
ncbi:MAG: TonB-dependent receptor [Deltaproteobacteria bacterium]|nr:TonB-dependent receptor [Deltaproteobacteria bacterium]